MCVCVCPPDRQIRHRACALKDTVHAIIRDELDEDFEKMCEEIKASRSTRGEYCVYVCIPTYMCITSGVQVHTLQTDSLQNAVSFRWVEELCGCWLMVLTFANDFL